MHYHDGHGSDLSAAGGRSRFLGVALGASTTLARLTPEMLAVFKRAWVPDVSHLALLIVSSAIRHLGAARLLTMAG